MLRPTRDLVQVGYYAFVILSNSGFVFKDFVHKRVNFGWQDILFFFFPGGDQKIFMEKYTVSSQCSRKIRFITFFPKYCRNETICVLDSPVYFLASVTLRLSQEFQSKPLKLIFFKIKKMLPL